MTFKVKDGVSIAGALLVDGSRNITANSVVAQTLTSNVATGTAPLVVSSTTVVTNLNADLLDGQHGSYYTNATNLAAGTVPAARLPQANATSNGAVLILDSISNTSVAVYAAAPNSVKTAYDKAVSEGSAAYSNAVTFAANASNLSSGTLSAARLPAFTGDATSAAGTANLTLAATGVAAGTYGNSSAIPQITVDAKGRITSASNVAVAGVSGFTYAPANNTLTLTTSAGGTYNATVGTVNNFTVSGDLAVSGNLTVSGTTTYVNSTQLNIGDNIITLNADLLASAAPTENAGVEINRGNQANVSLVWNETTDAWNLGNVAVAGVLSATGNVSGSQLVSTIANGTAPLSVASATVVTNLNADLLDGQHSTYYANATHTHSLAIGNGSVSQITYNASETLHIVGGTKASVVYDDATNKVTINSVDTTYNLLTVANTSQGVLRLNDSNNTNSEIIVIGGTGATAVSSNSTHIIVNTPASSASVGSTVVLRDASGNFAANTITSNGLTVTSTITGSISGNANTATALATARTLTVGSTGKTFNGTADVSWSLNEIGAASNTHNHTYDVNNAWLREANDDASFKIYGNTRQVVFRTDGTTEFATGVGASAFVWMYGGDAVSNKKASLSSTGDLTLAGSLSATSKSFLIDHPTKPGKKLRYGSLEGPENGVYVRGRLKGNVVELPEYWIKLVDPDSITVQLTPIGKHQKLYVEDIKDNKVYVANGGLFAGDVDCFYCVLAERVDVKKLQVEVEIS